MPPPREIYLVRHAIAEPHGPEWPDDDARPLTAEGIRRFRRAAKGLRALDVDLAMVLASPLPRTRHTAELLIEALDDRPELQLSDALRPGATTAAAIAAIDQQLVHLLAGQLNLAVVGHEPGIGTLAAHLIGLRRPLTFRKGAVACIALEAGTAKRGGTLRWFLPPRVLRHIS